MSTRSEKRAALLASVALQGADIASPDTTSAPVTKVKAGVRGNVKPITKATKSAVAKLAKQAAKSKAKTRKPAKTTQATSATLDDMALDVKLILDDGARIDADADKNCQAIVDRVAVAYTRLQVNAGNGANPAAIAKMFDATERKMEKAGTAFIRQLCDAWIGKMVPVPSAKNGVTQSERNYYASRAAKIARAVKVFIAIRANSAATSSGAIPLWDAKSKQLNVPLVCFIPPVAPKSAPDELWTFNDPLYRARTHTLLNGAAYTLLRFAMENGERKEKREGGAFTMTHLIDRFWKKPAHLTVARQTAPGTTAPQGADQAKADEFTAKQRKAMLSKTSLFDLLPYAVTDLTGESKPTLDDVNKDKNKNILHQLSILSAYYVELSAEATKRSLAREAELAAIAAKKGKPFTMGAPVTDTPIAASTKAEPIVDITSIADAA